MILLIFASVFFCVWSNDREYYIIVLCVAWYVLILGCILVCSKRFLTYVTFKNYEIHSYSFFSKELCTITTTNPIYYKIFTTPQGLLNKNEYIVLSNEQFEYQETYGFAKVRFIQHYNMSKQIILPYNEQTIQFLDLDSWYKIE